MWNNLAKRVKKITEQLNLRAKKIQKDHFHSLGSIVKKNDM